MKKSIFKYSIGFFIIFGLSGCYPEEFETYEETDIVVTDYNIQYDFSAISTYFMADTIHHIGDDDPDKSWDSYIIDLLEQEFESIGYTRTVGYDVNNPSDVVVTVTLLEIEYSSIYSDGWYGGWGWGGWGYPGYGWGYWGYPGYGSGYPWYGYPYISSYTVGTISWNIWDPDNVIDKTETIPIEYTAAINGLMGSSVSVTQSRISNGINKAFEQSPYLKAN